MAPVPVSMMRYWMPLGSDWTPGLGLVRRQEGVGLALVLARDAVELGLGLVQHLLLHVLQRHAHLLGRNGRVALGVAILDRLDDGIHVDVQLLLGEIATDLVADGIAELALLGCRVLRHHGARGHGREQRDRPAQLHASLLGGW
ncbi:MAG: hypothetical protein LKM39_08295 [Chiayiivirga sp.]|nr:hypothetical protein [Chiayiivirga sp.]